MRPQVLSSTDYAEKHWAFFIQAIANRISLSAIQDDAALPKGSTNQVLSLRRQAESLSDRVAICLAGW
jgi:hypothetical protein